MQTCEDFGTGKTRENFPVASRLIAPGLRAPIHAYYRFARAADDVADHARLEPAAKFELLDGLEATLLGRTDRDPAALPLRAVIRQRLPLAGRFASRARRRSSSACRPASR